MKHPPLGCSKKPVAPRSSVQESEMRLWIPESSLRKWSLSQTPGHYYPLQSSVPDLDCLLPETLNKKSSVHSKQSLLRTHPRHPRGSSARRQESWENQEIP